jgi:hypothetical protein
LQTIRRIFFQAAKDQPVHGIRKPGLAALGRKGFFAEVLLKIALDILGLERPSAGDHFVEDDTQTIDIGTDIRFFAARLLG